MADETDSVCSPTAVGHGGESASGTKMTIDWTPLADLIETRDRFLVTTHVRPDGDALGSEIGMVGLLRQRGKDVRVVNASLTPLVTTFWTLSPHFLNTSGRSSNRTTWSIARSRSSSTYRLGTSSEIWQGTSVSFQDLGW